jgi:hypothetical protein
VANDEFFTGDMSEHIPTYRVKIKYIGISSQNYGWEIYRNLDVLPVLRSQEVLVSRMEGLADANRARLQLIEIDFQKEHK